MIEQNTFSGSFRLQNHGKIFCSILVNKVFWSIKAFTAALEFGST